MGFRKGTGFTNLSKVIGANKGNKLGSAVGGGIAAQNQAVTSGVQTSQQKFQEEAQKNRLDTQEAKDKRDQILGRFAPATSGASNVQPPATSTPQSGTVQPPATPPGPGANTPDAAPKSASPVSDQEINDFTKFRTGTYAGPKELEDVGSLYGKAQQTEQLGDLSRSTGGRQELLRKFVGNGNKYNAGQRRLDETLLGQDANGVRAAARQTRGATDKVANANEQAAGLAQEYAGRAKIFGEETGKKIGEARNPLSTGVDTRVQEAQTKEQTRLANLKSLQDTLTGQGDYSSLDKMSRLGLGLQDAADQGYLTVDDTKALLGDDGLIARGQALGLDVNSLINERIKNTTAKNIGRTGIASEDEIAKLNALDRLSGKQGSDLEFLNGQDKYSAGNLGFDIGSLGDYISKSEAERAKSDQATADKIAARQARYMNQGAAGVGQYAGGAMDVAGAGLNQVLNPQSYYNPGEIGQNINTAAQGVANMGAGAVHVADNASNALLEGITKLNIGGKSIADTEGGRQLLKAIELKNKLVNETTGIGGKAIGQLGQGTQQLMSGNIGGALTNYYKAPTDIAKKLTSNVTKSIGGATKKAEKKLRKMFSDEDLKTDIDYSPKDVQNFMDRLKPASYNYKDEVKNDPRASKDRQIGVMAQDLEKSKLGKEAVHEADIGKVVDYKDLEPKMLASLAALNQRLKKLEGGGKDE
jgi:hypothetical protein